MLYTLILIIFFLSIFLLIYFYKNMCHKNVSVTWSTNPCKYTIGKTLTNILTELGIRQNTNNNSNNINIHIPCSYDGMDKEIEATPIKPNNIYFIMEGTDTMIAKEWLWTSVLRHHGLNKTKTLMPQSYVLYVDDDIKRFINDYDENKIYIMKKNIQRQEGLKITRDKKEIINGFSDGYVLVQELLQDPYTINGHKINMRFYVLIICENSKMRVYVYNNGFMYYTINKFIKDVEDKQVNITTGYIDRQIYATNPLTHTDFKTFLDSNDRVLSKPELFLRVQNMDLSKIIFDRIINMLKEVFISFSHKIKSGEKLKNNMSFQLYGVDVAINDELQPMIMEINKGPDMDAKDERDSILKHNVTRDIFKTVGVISDIDNGFMHILTN